MSLLTADVGWIIAECEEPLAIRMMQDYGFENLKVQTNYRGVKEIIIGVKPEVLLDKVATDAL